jgi:hypothetical protein
MVEPMVKLSAVASGPRTGMEAVNGSVSVKVKGRGGVGKGEEGS